MTELQELENFVSTQTVDGKQVQSLDRVSAEEQGFSYYTLDLAEQIILYQNDLAIKAFETGISDVTKLSISINQYSMLPQGGLC
ncbi:MAG: hypothetical protein AAGU75_23780 [Bacillota bacterium]